MAESLADQIIEKIGQAAELYYRLVLLVAPAGSGKTAVLRDVHERTGSPLINVNLELSRRMLNLTERQRVLQLPGLLAQIVAASEADVVAPEREATCQAGVVLLDNIELLFDVSLKQDPLRLLQGLSRNKTVVAAWSGEIRNERRGLRSELGTPDNSSRITQSSSLYLVYATPDHPEYQRYPLRDLLVVNPKADA
ncbi:BREX-3 system P-loop-containing protein BrxF [Desulfosoma caldarium]|uniref:ATPase family protein associated with various cellular activities (AAA) n=1 Tax=Desulfosoma caldarium TaxID=610254 RepID=A0A3N1UW87_9BACT|nr:BREX-3 system P-loop-containing protein BrxF [Desulfosoma caldarium]ROQ92181.1 ATPase family protein associated with various cellular activities (AAA) [Desulfosoma caldarium]